MSTSFSVASWTEQITLPFLDKIFSKNVLHGGEKAGPVRSREGGRGNLRWIDDFEGLAFAGLDELVVDEQASSVEISTLVKQAGGELGWGFTVVGMICRLEGESGEISQHVRQGRENSPLRQT